ncbi:DUF397 domain-containing protein [Streptomyces sp. NPDC058373]|uniref:DUF397 domain-containing protein n=1 Tax=Streptomyces sp. NPDC058373 TaxID=3346465 RepID=UPI0036549ED1
MSAATPGTASSPRSRATDTPDVLSRTTATPSILDSRCPPPWRQHASPRRRRRRARGGLVQEQPQRRQRRRCGEVAALLVRDSKHTEGPVLGVGRAAWTSFVVSVGSDR